MNQLEHTITNTLKASCDTYRKRQAGETDEWSAYVECQDCGEPWLCGIENNFDFICPNCH